MPDTSHRRTPDLQEISTRNHNARRVIRGFASANPTLTQIWEYIESALADAPALSTEINRLHAELRSARLDRANLAAAAQATIAAYHEGERDPLSYLHDELQAQGYTDWERD